MTLTLLHSKLFDVGDLPVLTFGNRVLKTGVIKWPLKLRTFFFVFFQNPKSMTFYVFLSCCTRFSRTLVERAYSGGRILRQVCCLLLRAYL